MFFAQLQKINIMNTASDTSNLNKQHSDIVI